MYDRPVYEFYKVQIFWEISTVDLSYVVPVKSTVEISQKFVAFSEYMNFNTIVTLKLFQQIHNT